MTSSARSVVQPLKPAAFLDRDGTVIEERPDLADPREVRLVDGTADALRALQDAGYTLVIITNQSGIARGVFTEAQFRAVQDRVEELLAEGGLHLAGVYHCPHHPDFTGPCDCRKPGVGLHLRAAADLGLDVRRSLYVGDRLRDVNPSRVLGGTAVLVRTGYGAEEEAQAPRGTLVVDDLRELAARLPELRARAAGRRGQAAD